MHNAYIGIGTNIEPRAVRMQEAIRSLEKFGVIEKRSTIYETAAYGYTEQADFLNAAVLLQTALELTDLHNSLHLLEKELGRNDRPRWHEREIDFDILFFDDMVMQSKNLTVPHAELQSRIFVLQPMNEIASDLLHPVLKKTIAVLLNELPYDEKSIHPITKQSEE